MKQKTTQKIIVSILAIFGLAFFISGANAQNPDPEDVFQETEAVLVATVNIYDAKVVSQDNNNFKISFDLSNRENAQPGIKYAVQLIKQENNSQSLVDEKVYSETVSLNADTTVKKEVEYAAPSHLSGKFQLWLISRNENGLTLALGNLGEVTLIGNNQFVEIVNNSCYLKVDGETEDKKYTLRQGVDIINAENLIGVCDVANYYDKQIAVLPRFETYWRTTFGKKVEDNNQPQQAITLNSGEKKTISLTLPKAKTPQAYDAKLTLLENNRPVSNSTVFHYVLRGPSATIQNLRLDKDYYQKGETARISFFWSPSADSFPDSRLGATDNGQMYVNISIKSGENKNCSNDAREKINPQDSTVAFNLPITSECADPKISVSIQDEKGDILDRKEYSLTSRNVPPKAIAKTEPKKEELKSSLLLYGIIFIIVLTIISLILIFIKRRKISSALIFFLIMLGGMFFAGEGARADTYIIYAKNGAGRTNAATLIIDIDKRTYSPNEGIKLDGTGLNDVIGCSNTLNNWAYWKLTAKVNSKSYLLFEKLIPPLASVSGSAWGTVEGKAGNYNAEFTTGGGRKFYIPYSVVCADTSWSPDSLTVCSGTAFTQTSNCGITRTTVGTKPCVNPCALPWGGTIAHNASITAYLASSVPCGSTCASETRVCANGVLSGTYADQSCSVMGCAGCVSPWGTSIVSGGAVTAYQSSSVLCGSTCVSETRFCDDGALRGSYTNQNCTVQTCNNNNWREVTP